MMYKPKKCFTGTCDACGEHTCECVGYDNFIHEDFPQ